MIQFILGGLCENNLVVLIEIALYCIFCKDVNCVLTEHLAKCERFKSFLKCKVVKSKVYQVPFFGLTFLYLPNVFIHEPYEFIHVRVVNKLPKFKFTIVEVVWVSVDIFSG